MVKRAALLSRVKRLERRIVRRPLPRVILALYEQEEAGEIVGFAVGNLRVLREGHESVDDCAKRAFELGRTPFIAAIYAHRPSSAVGRDDSDFGAMTDADAPAEPSGPEIDEYAVGQPGIGAVADREALIRMGAIRVPPERLI